MYLVCGGGDYIGGHTGRNSLNYTLKMAAILYTNDLSIKLITTQNLKKIPDQCQNGN